MTHFECKRVGSSCDAPQFSNCAVTDNKHLIEADLPDELQQLLCGNDIRTYNSALAFTSISVQLNKGFRACAGGVCTYRIHGELHHRIGSMLRIPDNGQLPHFAKFNILDAAKGYHIVSYRRHCGCRQLPLCPHLYTLYTT